MLFISKQGAIAAAVAALAERKASGYRVLAGFARHRDGSWSQGFRVWLVARNGESLGVL
jgi:hypothetical protein